MCHLGLNDPFWVEPLGVCYKPFCLNSIGFMIRRMATLMPTLSTCVSRMTPGERRLAERLEQKLDDDYLVWYDVPIGPRRRYPDFVVVHPQRGVLVLETKDWKLDTICRVGRRDWQILGDERPKTVINPLEQARACAMEVATTLERDPQLVRPSGPHQGKLAFPWGYGVVFTRITRKQFDSAGIGEVITPGNAICQDEMLESIDPEAFQQRLWQMFPQPFRGMMSLPQLDRMRWLLFPEVRVPVQGSLFDDSDWASELPSVMKVMDLQQEQLARSLGAGHRVIHGVAGSGKTMILGYRAEYLAQASTSKPILVLCYNKPLATHLDAHFRAKGLGDKVHVRNFHKWCRDQLVTYGQAMPPQGPQMFDAMVEGVSRGVERRQIPSGQYLAVLIDEGHDFRPEWLKLVVQMIDPASNSLLLLYDDAQSIYERRATREFSFKSVGIQAQGRTTILKINYRNTRQILQVANLIAGDVLQPEDKGEDGIPPGQTHDPLC